MIVVYIGVTALTLLVGALVAYALASVGARADVLFRLALSEQRRERAERETRELEAIPVMRKIDYLRGDFR